MTFLGATGWAAIMAVIELDATSLGQFMLCRPIVLGPVLGLLLGQPALGAGLGVLCELFNLESLPVGGNLPLNATVTAATVLLLALGEDPVAPELALPVGLLAGIGHSRLEGFLRPRRGGLNALVEARLAKNEAPGLGACAARELLTQAAATFALLLLILACRRALGHWWHGCPQSLRAGLRLGLAVSPWPALWSLVRSFKVLS